jgi:mono/diheme cytochrome c family protein
MKRRAAAPSWRPRPDFAGGFAWVRRRICLSPWIRERGVRAGTAALVLCALAFLGLCAPVHAAAPGDAKRGEYLVRLGGCLGCHTENREGAAPFAGGRALKTPFGTFFGPNITPHPEAGIGRWTEADFIRAMRQGRRPDGANYFPAFPYPSFTQITSEDLRDMWAFLRTLAPSGRVSRPHELRFPYGWRFAVRFWKWLFFTPGPSAGMQGATPTVTRGAYLVRALGHCGECHTPRNRLGAPIRERYLAGGRAPDGDPVPNLTPAGLEIWSNAELEEFFKTGVTREGDTVSEAMEEVVRNSTSLMSAEDTAAMIAYLRGLPPIAIGRP